jgi:hypothetical protein
MIRKIKLEVDGKSYELPKEITISHYGEIMRRFSFCETEWEKAYDIIGVLLDIPYTLLREFDPEKLADLSLYLQDVIQRCDIEYNNTFTFNKTKYIGLIHNKMTFGEYVDIANYMKDDVSIYMNIHKICAILYRPLVDGKIAPYNVEAHEIQSELFKQLPVKYFFGAFKNLITYFHQMKKEFGLLFGDEDDKRVVEFDDDLKDEDQSNLSWYKMIMVLADDDFTKIDYVTGRPMIECFNHLTYIKVKNEEIRQQRQKEQLKNSIL